MVGYKVRSKLLLFYGKVFQRCLQFMGEMEKTEEDGCCGIRALHENMIYSTSCFTRLHSFLLSSAVAPVGAACVVVKTDRFS